MRNAALAHEVLETGERRKQKRDIADFHFDQHRDACPICNGKSFHEIRAESHKCEEGTVMAMVAYVAHKELIG